MQCVRGVVEVSDFPPPPPWTSGFRAQRAAQKADSERTQAPPKSRGDRWEWVVLAALLVLVVTLLVLK